MIPKTVRFVNNVALFHTLKQLIREGEASYVVWLQNVRERVIFPVGLICFCTLL